ncbi:MAG: succinylglutamate desuccinylase/aspartoacylase family protein [Planctomycetes bacterium]|nr:succinylglutamate desuccinylase/aspartoacylase family protein [Planctomycetota bacterium]
MTYPLQLEEIHGQQPGPHLLITGGVHGDEFEPMAAIRRLMVLLREKQIRGRVTLVPVVNEPAYRLGHRTAEDGLDLARTCPGRADGSITEQIADALSRLIRTADLYIDLHTGGNHLRVLPLVGYMLHPDERVLNGSRKIARAFGLPIIWGTDSSLNGRSMSVARDAKVPAVYAEYQGGGSFDPAGVDAYVRGCINVMAEFGMLDEPLRKNVEPLIVEDNRPGSGHMQVNHPAPCEGFFQSAVTLGQRVEKDELLGTVTDVLGRSNEEIRAAYAGIVLVLHTYPRIEKDESVAVILPNLK